MIRPDTTRSGAARFLAFALLSPVLAQLASAQSAAPASLSGVKTYPTSRLSVQAAGTAQFVRGADAYYALAKAAKFDYRKLSASAAPVQAALKQARDG